MLLTREEPNERSGFHRCEIELKCYRGHQWTAPGYAEYGGAWLNDENDAECPTCGAWDGDDPPEILEEDR